MHPVFSRFRRAAFGTRSPARERKHKFISVRRKMITGIVCAIALVTLGQCVIEISIQIRKVDQYLDQKAASVADVAAGLAATPLVFNEDNAIVRTMAEVMKDDDVVYLKVVDSAGNTRCELGARLQGARMGWSEINYRTFPIGKLYVGISAAQSRISQVVTEQIKYSLLTFGIILAILILLISIITHYVMAPMESLKGMVDRASRGEYSSRASIHTNDEIGFLARFVDSSIQRIAQREERLRESESQYRLLADNSTDIISTYTADSTLLYLSPSVQRVLGYAPEELVGRRVSELVHPQDREAFQGMLDAPHAPGDHFTITYRMAHKDGRVMWLECANHVVINRQGEVELQNATREITDKMLAAHKLQESLEKYRVLFETLPVGVAFTDSRGHVAESNETFQMAAGCIRDFRYLDTSSSSLIYPDGSPVPPQDSPPIVAMRENRVVDGTLGIVDAGETRWINVTAAPFRQHEYGAVLACTDITDRIIADRLLLGEKERLRITLESIGDGVIATDSQGIVTLMNDVAAGFTGWPVAAAVGRPLHQVFDIYNESTGEPVINPVDKVLRTGAVVELANHTVLRAQDGSLRYIADSAAPILDSDRNILGVIMVVRDVSEQKLKEKAQAYQNYHDVLTGLYNRSFFEEELKRLDQGRQTPISIIMGDVNGLKLTNDVFGHDEGDNLLKRIAGVLCSSCRGDDIIARTGGDEFCILLPKTSCDEAEEICQRIYNACAAQQTGNAAAALRLSISLGYATKESSQRRLQSVLKAAEDSMYKRKLLESRSQHSSIVSTIRTTLNEKSHETEDHSYRLINYARMVGMKAMLNSDQLSDLELLAVMHDIGKITVDDAVLNKPGPLNDDEWEQIKKHPEMGYRIASSSPELMTIANCILTHHERWDGKGYPQGLSGADIPLLSRILTIVDSYDAMTQDRVYRRALSREAAILELRRNAGKQFDPEIVEIFIQCIEEAA